MRTRPEVHRPVGKARDGGTQTDGTALFSSERRAAMNARMNFPEEHRIRRDIGTQLRIEHEVAAPPPRLLMALLKELEIHEHDVETERLFAQAEARADELLRAAGRQPWGCPRLGKANYR
jgi:hypothetical protein